jgi:uncharacterized protein with GYD domain
MPTYISLLKFTSQGITNIKDHAKRRRAAAKAIAGLGGKLVSSHLTLGRYDLVVITQAPDDETAAKFALMTGSLGNVSTETMRAFTEAEYDKLISSLP